MEQNKQKSKTELRAVIRFLSLQGKTPKEIYAEMAATYQDNILSLRTVERWHNEFKRGRQSLEDAPRSGRPTTSTSPENIAAVEQLILMIAEFASFK